MRGLDVHAHHRAVDAFLRSKQQEDPARFQEVCETYPTLTYQQERLINRKERRFGLLGLEPVQLPTSVAFDYGFESDAAEYED